MMMMMAKTNMRSPRSKFKSPASSSEQPSEEPASASASAPLASITSCCTAAAEENEDWLATCAIYGDEWTESKPLHTSTAPEIGSTASTTTTTTTTRCSNIAGSFYGCVRIHMSTEYTAFFRSIEDKKETGYFRYFGLSQQPQLLLQFKYYIPKAENEEEEEEEKELLLLNNSRSVPPTSVTIQWLYYPSEWPDSHKKPFLACIWEESNRRLQEEQLSFGVCEYCQHEALLQYEPWSIFHQEDPFRMIRLPSITDSLYHTNYGTKIHVYQAARKLPPSSSSKSRKTTAAKSKKKQQQQEQQPAGTTAKILDAKMLVNRPRPATVEEYARQALLDEWKQLYSTSCPICFDDMPYSQGIILPCHHFCCEDCLKSLLHFKVQELAMYRNVNPFCCPVEDCRHALPIIGFVKQYLPTDEMDQVRKWIKDMKYPPCFSLDRCLSKVCGAMESMRRVTKDSTNVYCDQCQKHWCELCLKRLNEDGTDDKEAGGGGGGGGDGSPSPHKERCQDVIAWKFCNRYLAASDDQKQACEAKYPWIVSYAHAREHDGEAMTWILQNGQVCPNCANGVERIEGCFHMQCPTCATHFCYECGDELFPPYYGTHHCWEQMQLVI